MTTETLRSQVLTVDDLHSTAGRLEALLNTGHPDAPFAALVAHPHPLGGGTMHNKVVYHTAKAFSAFGLPVLRFNFRGTGLSEGVHDHGLGEQDDVRAALDWLERRFDGLPLLVSGFSFGSYVALKTAASDPRVRGHVGLGLPVQAAGRNYTYEWLPTLGALPKLFVSGDHDQFSPQGVLESYLVSAPHPRQIAWIAGADHFFAGIPESPASKLPQLGETLRSWLREEFGLAELA